MVHYFVYNLISLTTQYDFLFRVEKHVRMQLSLKNKHNELTGQWNFMK